MLLAIILTLYLCVSYCKQLTKKHILNSVYPYEAVPQTYDIGSWVKQLHLQQCAFVYVGGDYFAIFVEVRSRQYDPDKYIREYFLGYCDNETLNTWSLCSADVMRKRRKDCRFKLNVHPNKTLPRVHRRLCDITHLQQMKNACKCDEQLDEPLSKVTGFPSCFQPPVPYSICGTNTVCGLEHCYPFTINDRIHSVVCDPDCPSHQPFCEDPSPNTTQPRKILSFWTDWSNPFCTDKNCLSKYDEAKCINSETKLGDIDCLGPGTSCCLDNQNNCQCHIFIEDDTLNIIRTYSSNNFDMDYYDEEFLNELPLRAGIENAINKQHSIRSSNESKCQEVTSFQNIPTGRLIRKVNSDDIPDNDDDDDDDEVQEDDIQMEEDEEVTKKAEVPEKSEMKEVNKAILEKDIEIEQVKQSEDLDGNGHCVTRGDSFKQIFIILMHTLLVFVVLK